MSTTRIRTTRLLGNRLGSYRAGAPLDLRWPLLLACACAVFASAYEIGQATRREPAPTGRTLELSIAPVSAPIQLSLGSLPALRLLPQKPAHRHARHPSTSPGAGNSSQTPEITQAAARETLASTPHPSSPSPASPTSAATPQPSTAGRSPATPKHSSGSSTGSFDSSG